MSGTSSLPAVCAVKNQAREYVGKSSAVSHGRLQVPRMWKGMSRAEGILSTQTGRSDLHGLREDRRRTCQFLTVLRPYKCDICDENFTQRSSMMRHRKTHAGTVPAPPSISFVKLAKSVLQVLRGSKDRIEFVYEFVVLCVESDEYSYLTKYAINGRKKTKSRVASATLQLAPASREAVVTTKARYDEKREFLQVPKKEYLADSPPEGKEELHDELRLLETLRNTCPYCDKHFDDVYKVERHVENVHKRPYKCDLCPKAYVKAYKLRAHKKTHSETFYFECSICHLKYKMELSLKHHHIRVHSNCDFNFTCDHCGKRFKLKGDLLAHIGRTHMCDMQICRFCGKTVKDLKNHELRHQEIVKKYACHLCNKKFKTQTMLDNHLLLHKDGFKCHECGKKCSGPTALYNHKNIHHKPATLTCTVCGKIFSASNHFYQHVLTHAGLKPYRCDICNADFTQRTSLMRHRKTHPGTLPPPPPISIVKLAKNVLQSL